MHFLPVLAMFVLIAVVMQPVPSKADAETLAEPAVVSRPEERKQGLKTTTLSPRDFFLKHARSSTKAAQPKPKTTVATVATTTATTTAQAPTAKPKTKGKPKSKGGKQGKPARKTRAQCAQCSGNTSTTPVLTHMEKKVEQVPQTPVIASNISGNQSVSNAAPVVENQFYGDMMLRDLTMDGSAPLPEVVRAADTSSMIKANLIGLLSGNMTIDDGNV